jgi:uncharacterized Tic20 family protein
MGFPADVGRPDDLPEHAGSRGEASRRSRPCRAGLVHTPGLAAWLAKHGKALAPLVIWLHRNVG